MAEETREALRRSRAAGDAASGAVTARTPAEMAIPTWDMHTPMCVLPGEDDRGAWILSPAEERLGEGVPPAMGAWRSRVKGSWAGGPFRQAPHEHSSSPATLIRNLVVMQ